ncbi:uncharacterized protein LOC130802784 [Amaranthus tricolor]|uniref:uncharacterized protein LOC130802784 n=1 Tax=Amaranthus tricolor TaxID=29722 RepID=UPI00258F358C|nr:uncharacterized protein LOC130802784 [Amaranthus tricolor]
MLALKMKLLYAVLCFSLVVQGLGQCSLKNMNIQQTKIVKRAAQPVWNVTITNNCYCSQSNVRIYCMGIQTLKKQAFDPSIVKIVKSQGLVNNGKPIYPYTSIGFTYVSNVPLQFKFLSSQIACS